MNMNLCKLWELVIYREAWHATVHGVTKHWTQLRDWTTTRDVIFNIINIINIALGCILKLLRVNSEFSLPGNFFSISFSCIQDNGCSLTCDNHFMMYINQIIVLLTLNLYSAICQLYLNKAGRKNFFSLKTKTSLWGLPFPASFFNVPCIPPTIRLIAITFPGSFSCFPYVVIAHDIFTQPVLICLHKALLYNLATNSSQFLK